MVLGIFNIWRTITMMALYSPKHNAITRACSKSVRCPCFPALDFKILLFPFLGEDVPPMQLKEGVFRCIMQLYDCLLTEVHERCKKGLGLAKYLNSNLAFFCYDLLSTIEPRQVFELVCLLLSGVAGALFCSPSKSHYAFYATYGNLLSSLSMNLYYL